MGIDKFGTVSFTTETKAAEFVNYLEKGQVMATKCRKCGCVYFPPRMECSDCLSGDMEWFEITGKGKLLTYTEVIYGPAGFENDSLYLLAVAEFGNVRVFGRLDKKIDKGNIKIGMDLKLTSLKLPDARLSYHFEKA